MSRPVTPASAIAGHNTAISSQLGGQRPASYVGGSDALDYAHAAPQDASYLEGGAHEGAPGLQRSDSQMSQSATYVPSRGGTLKKKASLRKSGSIKRSGSKKSDYAGSVRSLKLGEKEKYEPEEYNSAFYCPIPTVGTPTELLANRFQAWRKVLKDLITYFRELQKSNEARTKILLSHANVISNTSMPAEFLRSGGIGDAAEILREFHKQAINEVHKSRELENEVIMQLTGLRSDLSQKIKEIKSLSGDFKNSVGKEQDITRKAVHAFQEAVGMVDHDAAATAGKGDPFIIKLHVERQLERQIEEENYLHRAYLNLEASGRELESIVVGEIQKAYNVLAGILKREGDDSYDASTKLREGPLAMGKDHEWEAFVTDNEHMVDPKHSIRQVKQITYPGKDHPAAVEVRSGMLERKSKYLKNYTPGWYILSPTHLHEFKSADRIVYQQPVMSLYLPEQKLGSHSEPGSSSHKFMLKGRQTGSMHRGHTWIFRAETHDTMTAWFSDLKELTEKRGEARNEFVRRTHARSRSGSSNRAASIGSADSQMEEDEADRVAFSGEQSVRGLSTTAADDAALATGVVGTSAIDADARSEAGWRPPSQRPQPGGRFPSEVNVSRGLQAPLSPSSGDSGDEHDREVIAAAGALPGSGVPFYNTAHPHTDLQQQSKNDSAGAAVSASSATGQPDYTAGEHSFVNAQPTGAEVAHDTQSQYREWVGTMAAGAGGAAVGASAVQYARQNQVEKHPSKSEMASSAPIPVANTTTSTDPSRSANVYGAYRPSTAEHTPPESVHESYTSNLAPDNNNLIPGTDIRASSGYTAPVIVPVVAAAAAPTPTSAPASAPVPERAPESTSIYDSTVPDPVSTRAIATTPAPVPVPVRASAPAPAPAPAPEPVPVSQITSSAPLSQESTATGSSSYYGTATGLHSGPITEGMIAIGAARPPPLHTKSVQTISDLHIPGEFPRGADNDARSP